MFVLPFMLGGLALLLAFAARVVVQAWGRPITATVDALDSHATQRGGLTHAVRFHYLLDGRRQDDSQQVAADEFGRLHVGDPLTGRAGTALGRSMALTSAGNVKSITLTLGAAALLLNGVVAVFAYGLYVVPRRERRLVQIGTAAPGEVTDIRRFRGRSRGSASVYIRYRFDAPAGPLEGTTVATRRAARDVQVGQPVTVLYDPGRPRRSTVFEYSGFVLRPAVG